MPQPERVCKVYNRLDFKKEAMTSDAMDGSLAVRQRDADLETLGSTLTVAAQTFAAAKTQDDRLWSLCEYIYILVRILDTLPTSIATLSPLNMLQQALGTHASGAPHPLLSTASVSNNPGRTPARIVELAATVLASEILYRGGRKRGEADEEAARLLNTLGLEGDPGQNLKKSTVTNWRSQAGRTGDSPAVGTIGAAHLAQMPLQLELEDARRLARDFAVSFLGTRYHA